MTLVIDIETIGEDFDKIDAPTKKDLTKNIKGLDDYDEKLEEIKNELVFSPLTGEIVAIGVLDSDKEKGVVYYRTDGKEVADYDVDGVTLKVQSEEEMLKSFWEGAREYDSFVTYNGRGFDIPYIWARSAHYGIKPSVDLMTNRYLPLQRGVKHIDLMDLFSFYGAVWKKGSLHMWCRLLGVKSPKADGVVGEDVTKLFGEGKFKEIAEYNVRDIIATNELFKKWMKLYRA